MNEPITNVLVIEKLKIKNRNKRFTTIRRRNRIFKYRVVRPQIFPITVRNQMVRKTYY
jgi:hypothetical protein